ncbi:MAG: hypothetical protein HLX51_11460 [Micrococcaceae bacterium]|uniref:hypothetical protein n=1 Tax=Yaniella flava TaxID=287930 RepID=UPI00181CED6C|nr:hypothetical protein [Micrococcaceae bacterium]
MPAKEFLEIEQLAGKLDIPVSALIRGWVLAALAEERGTSLRDAIDRVAAEADRLRRIAERKDIA